MIEVVSNDNMRKSDQHTVALLNSVDTLIERAAKSIFDSVSWKSPVAIVTGKGNNSSDGFLLAVLLKNAGILTELFCISNDLCDTSRFYFNKAVSSGVSVNYSLDKLNKKSFNTVVDCIFGTGFRGEANGIFKEAIEKINRSGAYIVSVDINSGLGGDSGLGKCCVHSDLTVSLGYFKSGHFLNNAKDVIKNKINCNIGIELVDKPAYLIEKTDIKHLFANRPNNSNKGDYGLVTLIGGSLLYSGAAKLANLALSALRCGAGISRLAVPECIVDAVLPYVLEGTVFPLDSCEDKYIFNENTSRKLTDKVTAAAVGMGMGNSPEVKRLLEYLLCEYKGRLIIDADGLNALSAMDTSICKNASCRLILTPHPKEFERLSKEKFEDFKYDLVGAAKKYAKNTGVILLLKGTTTIVTDGDTTYLIDRGCAGMATAGSGDVLSGVLAGICGYVDDKDLLLAVAAGAYVAGLAGEIASKEIPDVCMIASDTVNAIPKAVLKITE